MKTKQRELSLEIISNCFCRCEVSQIVNSIDKTMAQFCGHLSVLQFIRNKHYTFAARLFKLSPQMVTPGMEKFNVERKPHQVV
jgi:hypothetical protein